MSGTNARLTAVCTVRELRPDPGGPAGVTAIDKRPVDGPVEVGPYGLLADVQADREHHGGLEQALYVYAQEDVDFWESQLDAHLPPGVFGENLRTEGIDVNAARVGEVWRIGESVLVEVTRPRTPCQTFARWLASEGLAPERGWVRRFGQARRLGPYLRVVHPGSIRAGDAIDVVSVPEGAPGLLDGWRPRD